MKKLKLLFALASLLGVSSCFLGEKNKVSDYIEKPDYSLKSVEYVPVSPTFGTGITPVSLYAGYDQLLYAVDSAKAILSYDAAGNQLGRFELPGVYFVIQNRSLDLYALGWKDTVYNTLVLKLPVIYKISQKKAGEGTDRDLDLNFAVVEKQLIYPFCINEASKLNNIANFKQIRLSAIGFLNDNSYYVTSSGPQEGASELYITHRNAILSFNKSDVFEGGFTEGTGQATIAPYGLTTLVQPPQRSNMEVRRDFIYTSLDPDLALTVRYLTVVVDPNTGLFTAFKPLPIPSFVEADGYMYQTFRFRKPAAVLFAGTNQKYIFVADDSKDSVYAFQENGYEGVIPPPQYTNKKLIKVSFGGRGSGPRQFNRPTALAYANKILFVADAGNKRIARFKLTTDYE